MDVFETLGVLWRRWYLVLPMLLLTLAGAYGVYTTVGERYRAQGSIVLVTPPTPADALTEQGQRPTPCAQNPFCGSGSLSNLGNVVARAMADDDVADRIARRHPDAEYSVVLSPDDRSPIIEMTATATGAVETIATLRTVEREVQRELERRQTAVGVPPQALITSATVTEARSASVQAGGKIRATLIALGLGIVATVGVAHLAEGVSRTRARRRAASDLERDAEATVTEPAEPVPLVVPPAAHAAGSGAEARPKAAGSGAGRRSGRFMSGRADQRRS